MGEGIIIRRLALALATTLITTSVSAQECELDFDFVSPNGHEHAAQALTTLKTGLGAAAKGDLETFMSIAADPYIQHSPDLPDGWKPVWDLTVNRPEGFSTTPISWIGPKGFFDNGQYLVMFREVDRGNGVGPSKIFDLMYFDDDGKYAEHWDMQQPLASSTASGESETEQASKYADQPVDYDEGTENANRRLVASFINTAFNGDQLETALKLFALPDYIQHNPNIANGTKGVLEAYRNGTMAASCYDIRFILAQNDLVWVYSKVTNNANTSAVVDLIRVRDGKLAEHWDVIQTVPDEMPHDNDMF